MSHLTHEQRYTIEVLLEQNFNNSQVAKAIGKDKSVVSRELKRNCDKRNGIYRSDLAQHKYRKRIKDKPKRIIFTDAIKQTVKHYLRQDYSPEQIVGYCKKNKVLIVFQ